MSRSNSPQFVSVDELWIRDGAGRVSDAAVKREQDAIRQGGSAGRAVVVRRMDNGYEVLREFALYSALKADGYRDIPVVVLEVDEVTAIAWLIEGDGMNRTRRDLEKLSEQAESALSSRMGWQPSTGTVASEVGVHRSTVQKARDRRFVREHIGQPGYPATPDDVEQIHQRDLPYWCGRETQDQNHEKRVRDKEKRFTKTFEQLRELDRSKSLDALANRIRDLPDDEQWEMKGLLEDNTAGRSRRAETGSLPGYGSPNRDASGSGKASQASDASHRGRRYDYRLPKWQVGLDYERVQDLKRKGDFKDLERLIVIDKKKNKRTDATGRPAKDELIAAAEEKYGTALRVRPSSGS